MQKDQVFMERMDEVMSNCNYLGGPMWSLVRDVCRNITASGQSDHQLYVNLMVEEYKEFMVAVQKCALGATDQTEEVVDGALDLIWVTIGFLLLLGVDVPRAWAEVARSNHAKILPDGTMLRNEHGKFLKPDGWTAPNLAPFLQGIGAGDCRMNGFEFKDVATQKSLEFLRK